MNAPVPMQVPTTLPVQMPTALPVQSPVPGVPQKDMELWKKALIALAVVAVLIGIGALIWFSIPKAKETETEADATTTEKPNSTTTTEKPKSTTKPKSVTANPNLVAVYSLKVIVDGYVYRLLMLHVNNLPMGPLVRIRRSSDSSETDLVRTSDGTLVIKNDKSAITTWLGSGSGYVVKWYNQTGPGASSDLICLGTNVWFTTQTVIPGSGVQLSNIVKLNATAADEPIFDTYPTFEGWGKNVSKPGLLFAKGVQAFELPGEFTVTAWVWAVTLNNFQSVIGLGHYMSGFFIRTDGTFIMGKPVPNSNLSQHMMSGKWVHLALTRNSANLVTLWVDSLSRASLGGVTGTINAHTTTLNATTNCGLFVGCNGHTSDERWHGKIAECTISKQYTNIASLTLTPPS